jgi:four helix bundle protein
MTVDSEPQQAGRIRSHRDLLVWQKGMDLVDMIYSMSRSFPADEAFGLRSQIRRAAVSVPANIAEGQARSTSKDFANFLTTARSSLMETETELTVAVRQGYVSDEASRPIFSAITEFSKMLMSLRTRVLTKPRRR